MALNSLFCADVPLSNYSLTHRVLTAISQSNGNGEILTTHRIQTPKPITI